MPDEGNSKFSLTQQAMEQILTEAQEAPREYPRLPDKEKKIAPWAWQAMLVGQLADLGTTYYGWSKGDYEGNPRIAGNNPHPYMNVALAKAASIGGSALIMKLVEKLHHEQGGNFMGLASGALGAYGAANNLAVRMKDKQ